MTRLIDIAGRTGQTPVRSLLSAAIGSTDSGVLQPHEIRYRNDQHHVIYGLYDGDALTGLIGLARRLGSDSVEILHVALAADAGTDAGVALLRAALARQRCSTAVWHAPGEFELIARNLGFRMSGVDGRWELRLRE